MIFSRSGFFSPTLTSTSRPRLRKISSALGLNSSAMRILGMRTSLSGCLQLRDAGGEGPFEPRCQGLQVALLHGSFAPDAQSRRRRPIGCRIERNALLLQDRGQVLGEFRLAGLGQRADALVDHFQANTSVAS